MASFHCPKGYGNAKPMRQVHDALHQSLSLSFCPSGVFALCADVFTVKAVCQYMLAVRLGCMFKHVRKLSGCWKPLRIRVHDQRDNNGYRLVCGDTSFVRVDVSH
jgi:hypothetical protein